MELVPLFAVMAVTSVVLVGLIKCFKGWMQQRDDIMRREGFG